jgi:phosphatidate cytidylyltransferase
VIGADRAQNDKPTDPPKSAASDLALRVASAVVLAPLAVAVAYLGGWPFAVFWTVAAIAVHCEWTSMVGGPRSTAVMVAGAGLLVIALAIFVYVDALLTVATILVAAVVMALLASPGRRLWTATGVVYAAMVMIAPLILRRDSAVGFVVIVLLFAVVWVTDIGGYFAGRLIGGPKLWPMVSPKKTWAGALGGAGGAVLAALTVAFAVQADPLALAILALLLSAVSQAGDLFESAVKRRFGIKDAGHIIPGHGGVMDRLDGFVAAATLAAVIGILRAGADAAGSGLLIW